MKKQEVTIKSPIIKIKRLDVINTYTLCQPKQGRQNAKNAPKDKITIFLIVILSSNLLSIPFTRSPHG